MIPTEQAHLQISQHSDAGLAGKENEDRVRLSAFEHGVDEPVPSLLAVLADGVGDRQAGEVAAQLTVDTVSDFIAQSDASQPGSILQAAVLRANQTIQVQAELDPKKQGMGSTCLCAWVIGERLYAACVGNSRLYLLRERRLRQLSVDHALVLDEADGKENKRRASHLAHYLGSRSPVEVDLRLVIHPGRDKPRAQRNQGYRLRPNDRLLLCSDGLSEVLADEEIEEFLADAPLEGAAQKLVQLALSKGANDNLTAVILGMLPAQPQTASSQATLRRAILVLFLAITLGLLAWARWPSLGENLTAPLTPHPTAIITNTPLPTNTAAQSAE